MTKFLNYSLVHILKLIEKKDMEAKITFLIVVRNNDIIKMFI